jgi:hypothetical protein
MYKVLGISEEDWNSTPQSVQAVVVALQQQARLLEIRFTAYERGNGSSMGEMLNQSL